MKQIYDFDRKSPPVINENRLRAELERRRLQRQTALLAAGSLLIVFCLLLASLLLHRTAPLLSLACAAYVCIAVTGGAVITLVFTEKRRSLIKCMEQQSSL